MCTCFGGFNNKASPYSGLHALSCPVNDAKREPRPTLDLFEIMLDKFETWYMTPNGVAMFINNRQLDC